jgi:hypothetical protein
MRVRAGILLTPPLTPGVTVDRDAPLVRWDHSGGYDTAAGCEADLLERTTLLEKQAADETRANWYRKQRSVFHEKYLHGRCIASDDPRLKP